MPNEELHQRGLLHEGKLKGPAFGNYEDINIGATKLSALLSAGLDAVLPTSIKFPFKKYIPPKNPKDAKPDRLFCLRTKNSLRVVAVAEHKAPSKFKGKDRLYLTAEQGIYSAVALGAPIAIATDGSIEKYVDVQASLKENEIIFFEEKRSLNPAVLNDLIAGKIETRDPAELSERVWQHIWHATKDEPKNCLLTFVELFVLKFLSDNLHKKYLPEAYRFYELLSDPKAFNDKHGKSQIEYYIEFIRPHIKKIFQDNTICDDPSIGALFGLSTLVSKTSVINGFSFLRSSAATPSTYNQVFVDILKEFDDFGSLTSIDPEFKLRLYETFLKKSARQAKLGQFFTPRNVVRSIIKMAQIDTLSDGAVVLDPAAGVGGFVLEPMLVVPGLANNVSFKSGKPKVNIKFVGVDVDANTHILAKANMLIHFAESVRDPSVTPDALNKLMARTFVLMNSNETLGTLEYPANESIDLIMTNPPYVTQGSRIYKDTISKLNGPRNGLILKDYYSQCGLGLESLFIRYISGALKPGGRAFVIVPQGMLTRTESSTKEFLLDECNLLASIALPRNTFFNTPQKTYILAIEKRHTNTDSRPLVLCGIAKSIGETLDYRRAATPEDNVLAEIADTYCDWRENEKKQPSPFVKFVDPAEFSATDRWDVLRFWTDDELVTLGEREPAIDRQEFITGIDDDLKEIARELEEARKELLALSTTKTQSISIGDEEVFVVRRGKRVTRKNCDENPGDIPVYSGSKDPHRALGHVSEKWLKKEKIPVESKPIITVNANGFVGAVFSRNERCVIHDDVMVIEIKDKNIDQEFLVSELQDAIAEGNFEYEAKLYNRVKELFVKIPINGKKEFDLPMQKQIAGAVKRFNTVRSKLYEVGKWSDNARFKGY